MLASNGATAPQRPNDVRAKAAVTPPPANEDAVACRADAFLHLSAAALIEHLIDQGLLWPERRYAYQAFATGCSMPLDRREQLRRQGVRAGAEITIRW